MNKIKAFRNEQKLTVRELSELSGVAVGYISTLENQITTNPTMEVMKKISVALNKTVPEVFYPENKIDNQ